VTGQELRTPRLLLRRWRDGDIEPFAAINADPEVMRWFPAPLDRAGTAEMVERVEAHHEQHGYGLWAVEVLESSRGPASFVGFVGLQQPAFDLPFDHAEPLVEVGWRLARPWWRLGIATEAAAESLRFAHEDAGLEQVDSWTVPPNIASQAVMQRLGMRYLGVFEHPRASPGDWWRPHVHYRAGVDTSRRPAEASGRTSP
jgi:ribosomal-protein-alanine N-acetyltransferase